MLRPISHAKSSILELRADTCSPRMPHMSVSLFSTQGGVETVIELVSGNLSMILSAIFASSLTLSICVAAKTTLTVWGMALRKNVLKMSWLFAVVTTGWTFSSSFLNLLINSDGLRDPKC